MGDNGAEPCAGGGALLEEEAAAAEAAAPPGCDGDWDVGRSNGGGTVGVEGDSLVNKAWRSTLLGRLFARVGRGFGVPEGAATFGVFETTVRTPLICSEDEGATDALPIGISPLPM